MPRAGAKTGHSVVELHLPWQTGLYTSCMQQSLRAVDAAGVLTALPPCCLQLQPAQLGLHASSPLDFQTQQPTLTECHCCWVPVHAGRTIRMEPSPSACRAATGTTMTWVSCSCGTCFCDNQPSGVSRHRLPCMHCDWKPFVGCCFSGQRLGHFACAAFVHG